MLVLPLLPPFVIYNDKKFWRQFGKNKENCQGAPITLSSRNLSPKS
jgi:hypothetical protein